MPYYEAGGGGGGGAMQLLLCEAAVDTRLDGSFNTPATTIRVDDSTGFKVGWNVLVVNEVLRVRSIDATNHFVTLTGPITSNKSNNAKVHTSPFLGADSPGAVINIGANRRHLEVNYYTQFFRNTDFIDGRVYVVNSGWYYGVPHAASWFRSQTGDTWSAGTLLKESGGHLVGRSTYSIGNTSYDLEYNPTTGNLSMTKTGNSAWIPTVPEIVVGGY